MLDLAHCSGLASLELAAVAPLADCTSLKELDLRASLAPPVAQELRNLMLRRLPGCFVTATPVAASACPSLPTESSAPPAAPHSGASLEAYRWLLEPPAPQAGALATSAAMSSVVYAGEMYSSVA